MPKIARVLVVLGSFEEVKHLSGVVRDSLTVVQWGTALTGHSYDVIITNKPKTRLQQRYCNEVLLPLLDPGGVLVTGSEMKYRPTFTKD
jgi:hypothetical protein